MKFWQFTVFVLLIMIVIAMLDAIGKHVEETQLRILAELKAVHVKCAQDEPPPAFNSWEPPL